MSDGTRNTIARSERRVREELGDARDPQVMVRNEMDETVLYIGVQLYSRFIIDMDVIIVNGEIGECQ